MNAFVRNASAVLAQMWVWSLLLALSGALLVWFVGPLLAVDDYRFWASSTARLLTISVLFLLWGLAMVVAGARRAARLRTPEHQADQTQYERIENEQKQVRGRFKEALHTLKTSSRYGECSQRWRDDLPWYLLIGAPQSGKTRLLAASGLQFPLDRLEPTSTGQTPYCDWYFADNAVLVDTAGRYLTQADRTVDAAGWTMLLRLLRTRRHARPLDGVVVTLSVEALLGPNDHDLDHHARHVHTRLQDIQRTLRVDLPVYLVLTQADRLTGFAEYFYSTQGDAAEAVLGERLIENAAGVEIAQVRKAFEALLQRLSGELIPRLHQQRNLQHRGPMLDFAQHAAQLGERLCAFIELGFSAHRYQRINGLRGFYLTSAAEPRAGFIQGLFNRVIFAEAGLAVLQGQEQRRIRRRQWAGALAASLVIGAAGGLWANSYTLNQQRLTQLQALTVEPPVTDGTLEALPLLDARLAATGVFPPAQEVGWVERAGLYQGAASRPTLIDAYAQSLQRQLLPRVAALLEEQVRNTLGDRERLLDNLRAYLMLALPQRRDNPWLAQHMAALWSARHAADGSAQKRLNLHLASLLGQDFVAPLDDDLVAQARQALRGESLADVVYRMLREQARNLEPLRLAEGSVFAAIDQPIPGFYSKKYWQYFEAQGARLVNAIAQDNWVLGEASDLSAMDLRRLMLELEQRYFSEYADVWSEALGRIRLQEIDSLKSAAEQFASLTSAQSPLVQMLQQVRENTRLSPASERLGEVAVQVGALGAKVEAAGAMLTSPLQGLTQADTARRALQRRFEPLHQLLDEQHNPGTAVSHVLQLSDQLQLQLGTLTRESSSEQAVFNRVKRRMDGQQDLLGDLRESAARLPLPLSTWFGAIADDTWQRLLEEAYLHVNQRYQSEVYSVYAKAIRQRYPFNASAGSDVALSDFQEFFGPQGVLARFQETYLRPFISADGSRHRLRSIDGRSLPVSRSLLDQLSKVQLIRRSFFSEQGELSVRFSLAPYSLDQAVNRAILRLGTQQLEYRHGPIVPMVFQWPVEGDNGRSSLVLERGAERPLGIEKNAGAWSVFRLFDLMQSEPASGRDAQLLKSDLAGLRANYLLTSQRTPSPFQMADWRTFRLPEQL